MLWRILQKRDWAPCLAALSVTALAVAPAPGARAQDEAKAPVAQAELPSIIGLPEEYPIYGPKRDPRDALRRGISVQSGEGDGFLLALALAANINVICQAPSTPFEVETLPSWGALGYLHAASAQGGLVWARQSERTVLMWPQPDEGSVARAWGAWWKEQEARDEAREAVGDAEVIAALQKLELADTPEARRQLRQDYALMVRERLQEQVRAGVLKYLGQDGDAGGAAVVGRTVALKALPPATREAAESLARLRARSTRSSSDIWYDEARREQFWKQARLHVEIVAPNQPRLLRLAAPDPVAAGQKQYLVVGHYDPRIYNPNGTKLVPGPVPPRAEGGLRLEGERLPLRQVLDEVQKQSQLSLEVPLERLKDARLTLDVRGMQPQEFLQSLARIFLIEWKAEGKRVVAHETSHSEPNRLLLQMGLVTQFLDSREGNNDRGDEAEMARSIYDEAGEALLSPEGIPVAQLSPELQSLMRREAAEEMFKNLVSRVDGILPLSLEQAELLVNDPVSRPMSSVVRTASTRDLLRRSPQLTTISLLAPHSQDTEIVALPLPTSTLPEAGRADVAQATVESLVSAHTWARGREAQDSQIRTEEAQAVLRNVGGVQEARP